MVGTEEGLLIASDVDEIAGRIDYGITARGEAEFFRLLKAALREPDPARTCCRGHVPLLPAPRP